MFSVKIDYNYRWACKKYRTKDEMKALEDYILLQKGRGKERLEDYSTSVV